jgi:hypothetical protein
MLLPALAFFAREPALRGVVSPASLVSSFRMLSVRITSSSIHLINSRLAEVTPPALADWYRLRQTFAARNKPQGRARLLIQVKETAPDRWKLIIIGEEERCP